MGSGVDDNVYDAVYVGATIVFIVVVLGCLRRRRMCCFRGPSVVGGHGVALGAVEDGRGGPAGEAFLGGRPGDEYHHGPAPFLAQATFIRHTTSGGVLAQQQQQQQQHRHRAGSTGYVNTSPQPPHVDISTSTSPSTSFLQSGRVSSTAFYGHTWTYGELTIEKVAEVEAWIDCVWLDVNGRFSPLQSSPVQSECGEAAESYCLDVDSQCRSTSASSRSHVSSLQSPTESDVQDASHLRFVRATPHFPLSPPPSPTPGLPPHPTSAHQPTFTQ